MFKGHCRRITGASSGIGQALARALAAMDAGVILSGRNVAALEAVAKDCADALVLPFEAAQRELVLATGMERDIVELRRKDPEALFEKMSAMVREGYAKELGADRGGTKPG